jgi:DNA-directed RNA polymerase specialized sigma24 family protein
VISSAHTYSSDQGSELGWLYGIARNVVAADRRRSVREADAGRPGRTSHQVWCGQSIKPC